MGPQLQQRLKVSALLGPLPASVRQNISQRTVLESAANAPACELNLDTGELQRSDRQ